TTGAPWGCGGSAAVGGRSTCAGGGSGATGSGIGAGGRSTSGPGATRLAGGAASGVIAIGPALLKGCAASGDATVAAMAKTIPVAVPALVPKDLIPPALMIAFS